MQNPLWYKNAVFYEIYLRSFMDSNSDGIGDINGLIKKLDYLKRLGVDCIWLLPVYPSPRIDDGYDISDFYAIDPDYGKLSDFRKLVKEVHKHKMRIIIDLVLNHTSDQHPWFQSARLDPNSAYRNYYVWSDTDEKYANARIIFIDTEKSNWTWDEEAQSYYWHRFYACQPDLNYENPAVRTEMLNIMRFWLDMGIDGFRVDAVPYLFEKEGTSSENLPETHEYLKKIREFVDNNFPGAVLICEANQMPKEVVAYFGKDDEFKMGFHFPLMPKIFMSLRTGDKKPIIDTLKATPAIPADTQWGTFLRNHDELTLEMVSKVERDWMWKEYAPDPKMRLNLGIRRRLAPLLDNNQERIRLAYAILFSLPGSPFIYYGDEIGMGDNIELHDRDGVRTPMQWDTTLNAGFSKSKTLKTPVITSAGYDPKTVNIKKSINDKKSLWHAVQKLIKIRKDEIAFQTNEIKIIETSEKKVLAFVRPSDKGSLVILHNLSDEALDFTCDLEGFENAQLIGLFSEKQVNVSGNTLSVGLKPYQSLWLKPKKRSFLG